MIQFISFLLQNRRKFPLKCAKKAIKFKDLLISLLLKVIPKIDVRDIATLSCMYPLTFNNIEKY